jgi:hypothetical protein
LSGGEDHWFKRIIPGKKPEIRRVDDDDDDDDDMTIPETDGNMSSRDRFSEQLN